MDITTQKYSPTGYRIIGTVEKLECVALITGFNADGRPEWSGNTHVNWGECEQEPIICDGQRVFVDANGDQWLESELKEAGEHEETKEES